MVAKQFRETTRRSRGNRSAGRRGRKPWLEGLEDRTLLDGDLFEPNNTRAAATLLNVRTGWHYYTSLSIHAPSDVDWYKFTIGQPAQEGNYSSVVFGQGSIGLALYDQTGTLITRNDSGTTGELVSLADQPAGTYYVQVYGLAGTTCPDYTLHFNVPGADNHEPNDTRATATDLGALGGSLIASNLSIDRAGDEDWFRFATSGLSGANEFVAIHSRAALGNVDLELYNSSGGLIASSRTTADDDRVSLNGLPAGTYFARIFAASGVTNPNYSLEIKPPRPDWLEPNDTQATATNLDPIIPTTGGWYYAGNLSIHSPTDVDWFQFTTRRTALASHFVRIDGFDGVRSDLDLALFDSSGRLLSASETAENTEQVGLGGLAAGMYYVRVTGHNGATSPRYALSLNLPGPDNREPNDTSATAYNFGTLSTPFTGWTHLSIDNPTDVDWFQFTTILPGVAGTSIILDAKLAGGDLDMELYDSHLNKIESATGAHDGETISLDGRPAGTYSVKVFGAAGAANGDYNIGIRGLAPDLAEPNGARASAFDFGTIHGHWQYHDLSIHSATDEDWFRFQTVATAAPGNVLRIAFQNDQGDLSLALYDAVGRLITSSRGQGDGETIDLAGLPAGVYYAQVSGAVNPHYNFDLDLPWRGGNDWFEPNNGRTTATDLRRPQGETTRKGLSIGPGDEDWFRFETITPSVQGQAVQIDFARRNGMLTLELYDSAGTKLATAADPATDRQRINLEGRPAGTYYARVIGAGGATNAVYDLALSTPRSLVADWAEANDDSAHAYDLKTVQGMQSWAGLSIDRPGDVDWYRFAIAGPGSAADAVQLSFNHAEGGLALALYDNGGNLLDQATGPGDRLTISLNGRAAGPYRLKVSGATGSAINPGYSLTIQAPPTARADRFEPNEGRMTAKPLGTVSGEQRWDDLSINAAGDEDWFQFQTAARGTDDHWVGLNFDVLRDMPALEIYDSGGRLLQQARPSLANPVVSPALFAIQALLAMTGRPAVFLKLSDLPAGSYFVRVVADRPGTIVPNYSLRINAPLALAADWAGHNHARATAYDLGRVEGAKDWTNLAIDVPGQDDWFQFDLAHDGLDGNSVSIAFPASLGDLDLGLLDASGSLLAASTGTGGEETLSLKGLRAGRYFLRVSGYNGSTNPAYSLTIRAPGGAGGDVLEPNDTRATAFDFGPLQGESRWGGPGMSLAIADASDEDWFRFELVQTGLPGNFVRLQSDSTKGDVDLELFDSTGNRIAASAGLRDAEQISLNGRAPGTYSVRVFGFSGGSNPAYSLTINAPGRDRAEANDSRLTAFDLGQLRGSRTWDDFTIDPGNDQDWFRFELAVPPSVGNALTVSNTSNIGLLAALFDANGQPLRDSGALASSASIPLSGLPAGTYYARLSAEKGKSTPYSLTISSSTGLAVDWAEIHDGQFNNDARARAYDLKRVEGLNQWNDPQHPLTIDRAGDEDWFQFTLGATAAPGHYARIDAALADGDLDLELYDQSGNRLTASARAADFEQVSLAGLGPGIYYLRILGYSGATSPNYSLTIQAPSPTRRDWAEPNDSRETANDLRVVTGGFQARGLSIDRAGDVDWFRFQTERPGISGHSVSLQFAQALGDLDLYLYDDRGVLLRSSTGTGDGETISLAGLAAGTYFLKVIETDRLTNPNYALSFVAPDKAAGDWAEPNDSRASARDLRQVSGVQQWLGLSIPSAGDVDWFQFELLAAGTAGNSVAIEQDLGWGQLDLTLYDRNGALVSAASDAVDFQRISLAGRPAGVYFVKVAGHAASTTNPNYALWVNAPAPPGAGILSDWAEPNDNLASASDLGQVKGTRSWGQLSIDAPGNDDWFRFQTIATATDGQYAQVEFTSAQGLLGLALVRADGTVLTTAQASSDRQRVSLAGLAAGTYFLRVFGLNATTNPLYTITINAPDRPDRDWAEAHAGKADNDGRTNAFDLREVNGPVILANLSIHPAGDVDWFRFATLADGTPGRFVRIDFDRSQGALALELYDGSGQQLATSGGFGDFQQITLDGRPRGTYFVRVAGQDGATSPLYTLSVNATPVVSAEPDWAEFHDGLTNNDTLASALSLRDLQVLSAGKTSGNRDSMLPSVSYIGGSIPNYGGSGPGGAGLVGWNRQAMDSVIGRKVLGGGFGGVDPRKVYGPSVVDYIYEENERYKAANTASQVADLQRFVKTNPSSSQNTLVLGDLNTFQHNLDLLSTQSNPVLSTARADSLNSLAGNYSKQGAQFADQRAPFAALLAFMVADQLRSRANQTQTQTSAAASPSSSSSNSSPGSSSPAKPPSSNSTSQGQTSNSFDAIMVGFFYLFGKSIGYFKDADARADAVVQDGLSINRPGDEDWFQFTIAADAPAHASARIDFDHNLGQLALELRDAAGTALDRSDNVGDSERINLAGLPAGNYFLRVYARASGGTNPAYVLSLQAPPPPDPLGDWAEPNNSRANARDLGAIEGTTTLGGLSIHAPGDDDWFQFTTIAGFTGGWASSVRLLSDPALGDLDVALYDSAGTLIEQSSGRDPVESVWLGTRGPGTYFLKVFGYAGATNPAYSLIIQTPERVAPPDVFEPNNSRDQAIDLDPYNGTGYLSGLTITPGDHDYYRFETSSTATTSHFIRLSHDADAGALNIEVLDQNGNRVRPSAGQPLGHSVNLNGLPPGRYFAHALGSTPQAANRYALQFSTPKSAIGDWTILVYMTAGDLAPFAFQDVNELEEAAARLPSSVKIAAFWDQSQQGPTYATGGGAEPAWGGAGQAIIQPDYDRETVATFFTATLQERNSGDPNTLKNFIAWAKEVAPAQRYALIFWDHGQGIKGVNFDNADNAPADYLTVPEIAQALDDSGTTFDVIAFDACKMAMIEVEQAIQGRAGVIVGSEEIERGEGYNYRTAFASLQANPSGVNPDTFASGLVQSYQAQYQDDPRGGDTISAMQTFGVSVLSSSLRYFVDQVQYHATAQDWALIVEAREAAVSFANSPDYRDLGQFFQAIVDRPAITSSIRDKAAEILHELRVRTIALSPGRRRTTGLSIYLPGPGGSVSDGYRNDARKFLDVSQWDRFLSQFVAQGRPSATAAGADWAEANDLRALAYNLHRLGGPDNAFDRLSLHSPADKDWFRFFTSASGSAGNNVSVTTPTGKVVRVFVEDANGQPVAGSGGATVGLAGLPAGEYFVRVEGDGPSTVSQYTLTINAPGSAMIVSDWARGNDQPGKAQSLGVIATTAFFSGLALQPGSSDWFQFATPRNPDEGPRRLLIRSSGGPVSARLITGAGATIPAETIGNDAWFAYPSGGGASYKLEVSGAAGGYTLNFTDANPRARLFAGGLELADPTGSIDLGQTFIGSPITQTFAVRNDGQAPLHLSGFSPLPAGFSLISGPIGGAILPGGRDSFTIRFDAAGAGSFGGPVRLGTDDPAHPTYTFAISARAVPPVVVVPVARLFAGGLELADPTGSIDLGQTFIGSPITQTFAVRNDGQAPLHLSGFSPLPAGFSLISGPIGGAILPGGQDTFTIRFDAAGAGSFGGPVRLGTDDPAHPTYTFSVSARAVPVPDTTPPAVLRVATALDKKKNLTSVTITFSEPLDPRLAGLASSYRIVSAGRDRRLGTKDDKAFKLRPAVYNPATRSVTLRPTAKLSLGQPLRLVIANAAGLSDLAGNRLDGNRDGRPGGDFAANLTNKGVKVLATPARPTGPARLLGHPRPR